MQNKSLFFLLFSRFVLAVTLFTYGEYCFGQRKLELFAGVLCISLAFFSNGGKSFRALILLLVVIFLYTSIFGIVATHGEYLPCRPQGISILQKLGFEIRVLKKNKITQENTSPIHGPLPMIIFFNLILVRGQAARLF